MSESPDQHEKKQGRIKALLLSARDRLRGGEITPGRLGLSTALGLFVGCSPLYGLHSLIASGLAFVFRLDVLITYLASNISLPPIIPLLVFAEMQVGNFLLRGQFLPLDVSELAEGLQEAPLDYVTELGAAFFVGAGVLGGAVALVGGGIAYLAGRKWLKPSAE